MHEVDFYFDFISPYSWLAMEQAEDFERQNGVAFTFRPVVYGALLHRLGLVGPAENDIKRDYTFRDVARCAHALGLSLEGPPAHPFRSLEALRLVVAEPEAARAREQTLLLSRACWKEGRDSTDPAVLAAVTGLDASAVKERITRSEVKEALKNATDEAVQAGVFGVPTFRHQGTLFWGHDRLDQLAAHLKGDRPDAAAAERMLARPRGVERRR